MQVAKAEMQNGLKPKNSLQCYPRPKGRGNSQIKRQFIKHKTIYER
jgi:hypothetical protein